MADVMDDGGAEACREGECLSLLLVEAGRRWFAVPVDEVLCIEPAPALTPIPLVDERILGVGEVRGDFLVVADLARLAGGGDEEVPARRSGSGYVMVLGTGRVRRAYLIDKAHCMERLQAEALEAPPSSLRFLRGLYVREKDTVVYVLDSASLMEWTGGRGGEPR